MDEAKWQELSRGLGSQWTKEREGSVRRRIDSRLATKRPSASRWLVVAAAAVVLAFGAGRWTRTASPERASTQALRADAAARVTSLAANTSLEATDAGGRAFVLRSGAARFDVAHDAAHPFHVRVRTLVVEDIGTIFTVDATDPVRVAVRVEEGSVRVIPEADGGNTTTLSAGAFKVFDTMETPPPAPASVASSVAMAPVAVPSSSSTPHVPPRLGATEGSSTHDAGTGWKSLAQSGRFDEAFAALGRDGPSAVHEDVDELLLAADAARMSNHPNDAVPYLRKVVDEHGADSRSGLARFTLGRLLLDELGRPADAAQEFAKVRATSGPLAEDACAHEVEAWARAGDVSRAHAVALEYRATYPNGRRAKVVARFGGIE